MIKIRHETQEDIKSIHDINLSCFETDGEACLVDKLRLVAKPFLSLVAIEKDEVIGHILFTSVTVEGLHINAMGLGPMAVSPQMQGRGVGSSLVKDGLSICRQNNVDAVFVLGEPEYYTKFGFELASEKGLYYKSDKFAPYFMCIELNPGSLSGISGEVFYNNLFDDV